MFKIDSSDGGRRFFLSFFFFFFFSFFLFSIYITHTKCNSILSKLFDANG